MSIPPASSPESKTRDRARFHIPERAFIVFANISCCSGESLQALIETCLDILQEQPSAEIHFLFTDDVKTKDRQKEIDLSLRIIWKTPLRKFFHVYALSGDIPGEFFSMSDACIVRENDTRVAERAFGAGVPVLQTRLPHKGIRDDRSGWNRLLSEIRCAASEEALNRRRCSDVQNRAVTQKTQPSLSLIMRASSDETVRHAIDAATAVFPFRREFIIATSPRLKDETLSYLRSLPDVRFIEGTSERERAGALHYTLMDACEGDWIVNVDDDDLWLHAPDLAFVDDQTGLIFGDYFFLNYYKTPVESDRIALHRGIDIEKPEDVNRVHGSMWIARTKAWKSVSSSIADRSYNYSDWRAFHAMLLSGWKLRYNPKTFGIQRRFKYDFPSGPNTGWAHHLRTLPTSFSRRIES